VCPLGTAALFGLLYQPRMIDDDDVYGAVGIMRIWQGKPKCSDKSASVPLSPPQIPHDLTRAGTWNPDRRGGKPATNRLSCGPASVA
jgi:hypothetical protein